MWLFPSTPGVSLKHMSIFPADTVFPNVPPGQTDWKTHHCACMPISDLTCWQLPNSLTFLYPPPPFLFFWTLSLSHGVPQPVLSASRELMLILTLWFAVFGGVLCTHCTIWLAFWVTLQVWGGAGFHYYHKDWVRDRLNDRGYNLDESSCRGREQTKRGQ